MMTFYYVRHRVDINKILFSIYNYLIGKFNANVCKQVFRYLPKSGV